MRLNSKQVQRSIRLALETLVPFGENPLYDDYRDTEPTFTDDEYDIMIAYLQGIVETPWLLPTSP